MKKSGRILFGLVFVAAGCAHFARPEIYLAIMPPYLPRPAELVALSGFAEIAFGAALCFEPTRRRAAWGLILLLIGVFPANIHMALHPAQYPTIPVWVLWARLPFQFVLIYWSYGFTKK